MKAADVMSTKVVSLHPDTDVSEAARVLEKGRISGAPVIDDAGRLVGILSEGDLMRRPESGTARHPSWWLNLLSDPNDRAVRYIKEHGRTVSDVMTRKVITVAEDADLETVADLLEGRHIKRVPVMRRDKVVGIVSRANLLHGLVARQKSAKVTKDDREIRSRLMAEFETAGLNPGFINATVCDGEVRLWGVVNSGDQKRAAEIAATAVPGVTSVVNNLGVLSGSTRAAMWAE